VKLPRWFTSQSCPESLCFHDFQDWDKSKHSSQPEPLRHPLGSSYSSPYLTFLRTVVKRVAWKLLRSVAGPGEVPSSTSGRPCNIVVVPLSISYTAAGTCTDQECQNDPLREHCVSSITWKHGNGLWHAIIGCVNKIHRYIDITITVLDIIHRPAFYVRC
jgi:hypothetical protein